MHVDRVDPSDHEAFARFHHAYLEATDTRLDEPWSLIELRAAARAEEYVLTICVAVTHDQVTVAGGIVEIPLHDNPTLATVHAFCPPEHRRQGRGSLALEALLGIARDHGRTLIVAETTREPGDGTSVGMQFARAHGFEHDTTNARRDLMLPAEFSEPVVAEGYRLVDWRGIAPDDLIDDYARMRGQLNSEAPAGVVRFENEHWDAARIHAEVEQWAESDRICQTAAAIGPDGSVVGHTQLVVPVTGDVIYQWDTLVLPEHRGHGLGLALKAHAYRAVTDLITDAHTRIATWNDVANTAMIAVNEQLGYRLTAYLDQHVHHLAPTA